GSTSGGASDPGKLRFFAATDTSRIYSPQNFTLDSGTLTSMNLSWSSGGGLVNGYKLVYAVGPTAPANCELGTLAYNGPNLTYSLAGLTGYSTYSFRICSYGNEVNTAPGVTATYSTGNSSIDTLIEDTAKTITLAYDHFGGNGAASCIVSNPDNVSLT